MRYFEVDVSFRLKNRKKYSSWINEVAKQHGRKVLSLSINFCSDEYLLFLNKQYLNHNYYTDIITFDYCKGDQLSGELYISVDRIKDNASNFGIPFISELNRVIIHGVLHLCGFKDKTPRQLKEMRKMEEEALFILDT